MNRRKLVVFLIAAMVTAGSLTACQEVDDNKNRNEGQDNITENMETEPEEIAAPSAEDVEEPDSLSKANAEEPVSLPEENLGETASLPEQDTEKTVSTLTGDTKDASQSITEENTGAESEMTPQEMHDKFFAQFYKDLSYEEIEQIIMERNEYYHNSSYYGDIVDYWENERGIYDISGLIEPLYFTDMKYYTEEDFRDVPSTIIHLAKNEIYARRGYMFENKDISNYFMSCAWYQPVYSKADFDDSVFNDYERQKLELLAGLDQ